MTARGVKLVGKRLQMMNLGAVELQSLPTSPESGGINLSGGNAGGNALVTLAASNSSAAITATSPTGTGATGNFNNTGGGFALSANSSTGTGVALAATAATNKSPLRLFPGGAALPTGSAAGDFFVDSSNVLWFYNGISWLPITKVFNTADWQISANSISPAAFYTQILPVSCVPIALYMAVLQTNNGDSSNNWSWTFDTFGIVNGGANNSATNTIGYLAGGYQAYSYKTFTNSPATASNIFLGLNFTKTGNPGNITVFAIFQYRPA